MLGAQQCTGQTQSDGGGKPGGRQSQDGLCGVECKAPQRSRLEKGRGQGSLQSEGSSTSKLKDGWVVLFGELGFSKRRDRTGEKAQRQERTWCFLAKEGHMAGV